MDTIQTVTRRSVISALPFISAVAVTPVAAFAASPIDDELVALGHQFLRLHADASAKQSVAYDLRDQARKRASGTSGEAEWALFISEHSRIGGDEAEAAMMSAWDLVYAVGDRIRALPAQGLQGIWAKLVALRVDCGIHDDLPREEQDLHEERFNILVDEVAASTGLPSA